MFSNLTQDLKRRFELLKIHYKWLTKKIWDKLYGFHFNYLWCCVDVFENSKKYLKYMTIPSIPYTKFDMWLYYYNLKIKDHREISSFFCWVYIKAPCVWATHRSQVYPETFKWLDIEINSIQFYGYYLHREKQWPVLWPVDITFLWRIGPIQCKGACDNFVKILLLSTK